MHFKQSIIWKLVIRVTFFNAKICRPHYFCDHKYFWTPYFAILAKTLDGRMHTKRGPRRKQSAPPVFDGVGHNEYTLNQTWGLRFKLPPVSCNNHFIVICTSWYSCRFMSPKQGYQFWSVSGLHGQFKSLKYLFLKMFKDLAWEIIPCYGTTNMNIFFPKYCTWIHKISMGNS